MQCVCKDWKENIEKVDGPILLQAARSFATSQGYDGKPFQFCPWCGEKLETGSEE